MYVLSLIHCSPITMEVMKDPVVVNGNHYERASIKKWISIHNKDVYSRQCGVKDIHEDREMKRLIAQYIAFVNIHN